MFGLIIGVISGIWDAFQGGVAAAVAALWATVSAIGATLAALGVTLWKVIGQVWGFVRPMWDNVVKPLIDDVGKAVWSTLKSVYSDILKPAWDKFNSLVTRLHGWLQTKFAPILKWLTTARKYVQGIYDTFVKPVVDVIDVAKQALNILAQLGVAWAKQLEQDLSELEAKIEEPFNYVEGKLNELINWVNQIVDLDGLFQRVTLLNSLVRDVNNEWRILINSVDGGDVGQKLESYHTAITGTTVDVAQQRAVDAITTGGGDDGPLTDEMAQTWMNYISSAAS